MKNQFRSKTLLFPLQRSDAVCKSHVGSRMNDLGTIRNTSQVDFNDKNPDNVRFVEVNSMRAIGEQLTAEFYVDNAKTNSVDESSLLRLDHKEKFNPFEQVSIILNSTLTLPKTIIKLPNKSNVDSLHESNRNRRDLASGFSGLHNEVVIKN